MSPTTSDARAWVPEACTLPTAERPLRVAEFDELFGSSVKSVRRVGLHRLELVLRPGSAVAARAADLAARETGCCSFFTFTLTITDGSAVLGIDAPAAQAEVLDALAARADSGRRGTR